MREIKFRGKHTHVLLENRHLNDRWIYGYLCNENYINSPELEGEFWVDRETICQYTGLKDKNGKEIYEGDICEFSVFDYNDCDTQYKGVVVYSGSRFMLWKSKESEYYGNDGGFDLDWVISQDDEFEVIGNIYGNPELLGS